MNSNGVSFPAGNRPRHAILSLPLDHPHIKHRSLDMTLRYAKIASRTVADEYFAATDKVDALYGQARSAPAWPGCAASTTGCSATATAPGPPSWTARSSRSAKPARFSRPASSSGQPSRPSAAHSQAGRQQLFGQLLNQLDQDAS